jgi:ABC-type antimicrobial peptide transport system permease subunit
MIKHYLKVAFRNMWKYRSQTFISVAGLAVGFVCFAMATLWIRYEMSYDSFHKNADRIYCVSVPDRFTPNGVSRECPYPLAKYLKATFPEIVRAVQVNTGYYPQFDAFIQMIDSSFLGIFDIKLVEGSMDFLIPESKNIAITRKRALQMFGNVNPVGKKVQFTAGYEYTVCAVVTGFPKWSNYPFDFLRAHWTVNEDPERWVIHDTHTLVEISPNVDIEAFRQKLYGHKIQNTYATTEKITLTPLVSVHYEDANIEREVKFQHIVIFAVAASLLILCTLFNYLTLFVSRFRTRQRELALRTVYGASGRSLFAMLSVEFVMSLIAALLLGMLLIRAVISPFRTVSAVRLELSAIYLESVIYLAIIIVLALMTFLLTLAIFKRRTLSSNIRGNRKVFRKMSIAVQLIISILFTFCTVIILKQMYYLHNTDLGFAFKNRASVHIRTNYEQVKMINEKIKQIPEIEEALSGYSPLLPAFGRISKTIRNWEGIKDGDQSMAIECRYVSEQYIKYYEFELIEGEMLNGNDTWRDVLINESAAKVFGQDKAVGKTVDGYRIKGVLKNIYSSSPTIAAKPIFYTPPFVWHDEQGRCHADNEEPLILFRYAEGSRKTCVEKIRKIVAEELPNVTPNFYYAEEEYDKFLKSENILLAMLTVISIICVIVCVFGFVSMVSLTCEERRREIAIRKINGATVKDILDIFFKEYLTLLAAGALIAFPAGYLIMKRWLESYVVQTEMSAWIYVAILLALFMAIVLCVGGQVYRTSRENPIEAIK